MSYNNLYKSKWLSQSLSVLDFGIDGRAGSPEDWWAQGLVYGEEKFESQLALFFDSYFVVKRINPEVLVFLLGRKVK